MLYALMDCNNFYASCEKAFDPSLAGRPVAVLSNNDGCIISRSREAKELGVPMGEPEFKCRAFLKRHGVAVFSSNYALYGDMSARVMATAAALVPRREVYSIDEAFLDLTGLPGGPDAAAREIARAVLAATGIPVSIGAGPTRTLAKAANRMSKKDLSLGGVLILPEACDAPVELLARLEAGDVWGIGRRHARRLAERGVRTALDFARLPRGLVQKSMGVTGLHTWLELHGTPCIPLDKAPAPRRSVVASRSFGRAVTSVEDLREAVSCHAASAARRLREEKGVASLAHVWIQTYEGHGYAPEACSSHALSLSPPCADTLAVVRRCLEALEAVFTPGKRYKKAGVMLSGIEAGGARRLSLLDAPGDGTDRLMAALDAVNARWGRDTLHPASCGVKRSWEMRQAMRSPRYTTAWGELPVARA